MPPAASGASGSVATGAARDLQGKLHELLSRLSATAEHVRDWPAATSEETTSIHVESTTRLIESIRNIVEGLEDVERIVKQQGDLRRHLKDCPVPVDLLELLDCNLNPDCFSRGLLRETMGQLSGLKRRKQALEMLGSAVQKGLDDAAAAGKDAAAAHHGERERDEKGDGATKQDDGGDEAPPTKKPKPNPDTA